MLRAPTPKDQKYTPKRATLKKVTRASCSIMATSFSSISDNKLKNQDISYESLA